MQNAEEKHEYAEASVGRDIGLDLAIQSHTGDNTGEPDDETCELDAKMKVEPERVHAPEVACYDGADRH